MATGAVQGKYQGKPGNLLELFDAEDVIKR